MNNPCSELNIANKYVKTIPAPSAAKIAKIHVSPNNITTLTAPLKREVVFERSDLVKILADTPHICFITNTKAMKLRIIIIPTGARNAA